MIRRIRNRRYNEELAHNNNNIVDDFCNEIISAFENEGISCDIYWNDLGFGEIFLWGDYEQIQIGNVYIEHDVDSYLKKGRIIVQDRLDGTNKVVGSFKQGVLPEGRCVFESFDPVEVEEAIDRREPDDYDESVKRTRASRESRIYEGTVSARTLSGLFRSLKNDHPNTTVAKQSSGMIWKGDVVLHIRNAGWNESGDWIDLGFSLSPDKTQLTVYETKSGKKEVVTSVNQFQEALESLGVRASVIDSITQYL